jgi:MATE family multidrug resistance protein
MTSHTSSEDDPIGIASHIGRTLRLAIPVTIARAGLILMVTADTVMSGRAGAAELAFYGIAGSAHITLFLLGIGLLQGTMILVAQAHGAKDFAQCGQFWRVGLIHAVLYGALLGGLLFGAGWFFGAIGQSAEIVAGAGAVARAFAWGLPAIVLFAVTTFFLEAMHRPGPGMFIMLAANVVNIGLNWLFIYGHWGLPALGAEGAALATSIVRWLMFLSLLGYVLAMREGDCLGIRGAIAEGWDKARRIRRLGYPIGFAYFLEAAAMGGVMMMAGRLGIASAAGYQIAMNLVAFVFMLTLGFATAANVRVGNAVGRADRRAMAEAGWVAVGIITVTMLLFAVLFFTLSETLATLYTDDVAVRALAASVIAVAGVAILSDGPQGVLMGALRGMANVWIPSGIQLAAFWGVMVPLAYTLAFALDKGAEGLMWANFTGFLVASLGLAVRFRVVSRRPVVRY